MSIRSEFEKIKKEISEKIPVGHPDFYEFPAVQAEIALFSRSLEETVKFLDRKCDVYDFGWMSKVFRQISANLKSWEFIDALYRATDRFSERDKKLLVKYCIPAAEKALPEEIYKQRFPNDSKNASSIDENRHTVWPGRKKSFKSEYLEILKFRKEDAKEDLSELPDYFDVSPVILAEIAVLSRNLQDTVNFLDHDCTGEQLAWMSEVFDYVSANLKSWEFIDALERAADRFPKTSSEYNIRNCIKYAIGVLPEEVYGQRFPDEPEEDGNNGKNP